MGTKIGGKFISDNEEAVIHGGDVMRLASQTEIENATPNAPKV